MAFADVDGMLTAFLVDDTSARLSRCDLHIANRQRAGGSRLRVERVDDEQ
jgi:hypothetical protein